MYTVPTYLQLKLCSALPRVPACEGGVEGADLLAGCGLRRGDFLVTVAVILLSVDERSNVFLELSKRLPRNKGTKS